jgi:hypothetical protein
LPQSLFLEKFLLLNFLFYFLKVFNQHRLLSFFQLDILVPKHELRHLLQIGLKESDLEMALAVLS